MCPPKTHAWSNEKALAQGRWGNSTEKGKAEADAVADELQKLVQVAFSATIVIPCFFTHNI